MNKYGLKPEYIKRQKPNDSYKRIEKNVKPNLLKRKNHRKAATPQ